MTHMKGHILCNSIYVWNIQNRQIYRDRSSDRFFGFPNHFRQWLQPWNEETLLGRKAMTNLDNVLKKQRHHSAHKGPYSQSFGFFNSYVWMWELDHKEVWALKNWCFWTVMLEKTLESLLDCKEIKSVHPEGSQPWIFIGRTDAEAEAPILWPDVRSRLTGKDPDAGKDWEQERRGWQRIRCIESITDSAEVNLGKLQELV